MSQLAVKMQQDLEKKLRHLCLIHDQPALHVSEHFFELRNQIDIETEELLSLLEQVQLQEAEAKELLRVSRERERIEFLRILKELEELTYSSLLAKTSARTSTEAYGHFSRRIEDFKACADDLLKEAYLSLAMDLVEETNELEKRLFGEQSLFYVSSGNKSQLGHLVYVSEDRLMRHEVECLQEANSGSELHLQDLMVECFERSLVVESDPPLVVTRNYMIASRLVHFLKSKQPALLPKFICMGRDAGYSAVNSSIPKSFLSYQFGHSHDEIKFECIDGISPALDLFDFMLSERCAIRISESSLDSLNFLSPASAHRLSGLTLTRVHLESFDQELLAKCVNLKYLQLDCILDNDAISSLEFLRPLKKLIELHLPLSHFNLDLSVFKELKRLSFLKLSGALKFDGAKAYPKMKAELVLKPLSVLPSLRNLVLAGFEIDAIYPYAFAEFQKLEHVLLRGNRIGCVFLLAFNRFPIGLVKSSIVDDEPERA